jgi:excisionase family DNA binding protein
MRRTARPDPLELLDLSDIAAITKLSDKTIRRLITAGDLPAVRVPGRRRARRILIRRRDLEAAIAQWSEPR